MSEVMPAARSRPTMRDVAERAGVSLKTVSRVINEEPGVAGRDRGARGRRDRRARLPAQRPRALAAPGPLLLDDRPGHRGHRQPVLLGDRPGGRGRRAPTAAACSSPPPARRTPTASASSCRRCCAAASTRCCSSPPPTTTPTLAREAGETPRSSSSTARRAASRPTPCCSTTAAARAARSSTCSRRATGGSPTSPTPAASTPPTSASPATATRWTARASRSTRTSSGSTRTTPTRPRRVVRELLALAPDRRPTAIFTGNNRHTVGALRALRGLEHEVALVGFDDFELADLLVMPTTVVRHDSQELGRHAADARLRAARRRRRAAPARRGPHRARDPRIRGGPAAVKPLVLPPNVLHHFYAGGRRIAELRGARARRRPHARGVDRRGQHDVRTAGARAQPARRRHASCATRSPPTPRATSARSTSPAGAPTPACWSSCSTPASASRCTSTRAAPSRRRRSGATTARPRPGSSSRPSRAPTVHVGFAEDVDLDTVRGWMRRAGHRARCSPRCASCTVAPGDAIFVPGRHAARDRRGHPAGRAAGADRPLDQPRVGRLRLTDRGQQPRPRLGPRAAGARPDRLGRRAARGHHPAGRRPLDPRREADPYFRAERAAGRRAARRRLLDPRRHRRRRARCAPTGGSLELRARQRRARAARRGRRASCAASSTVLRSRPADPAAPGGRW